MISKETPHTLGMQDTWIVCEETSQSESTICRREESQQGPTTRNPIIADRRNLYQLNSWPPMFLSSSLTSPRQSSRRRRSNGFLQSNRVMANDDMTGDRWEWHLESLNSLPQYYKLECTAKRFYGILPHVVTKRISSFMRLNSISATYRGDHVECVTSRFLKFVIQLWGEPDSDVVIVEVQRRIGCCLLMKRIRSGVYEAIASDIDRPAIATDQQTREVPRAVHSAKLIEESNHKSCSYTLQMAERLLMSDCVDQNNLGMECLRSVLDTTMSDQPVATCVAKAIACGTGKPSDRLRAVFSDYFHDTYLDDEEISDYDDEDDCITEEDCEGNTYLRGDHFGMLHMIALQVLENSLKQVSTMLETGQEKVELDSRSWFWRNVLDALIYNIEVANVRPLEAVLSSKCLRLVMTLSPELQHCRCVEERLIPGLANAHTFGRAHHLKLETESENLMNTLH